MGKDDDNLAQSIRELRAQEKMDAGKQQPTDGDFPNSDRPAYLENALNPKEKDWKNKRNFDRPFK